MLNPAGHVRGTVRRQRRGRARRNLLRDAIHGSLRSSFAQNGFELETAPDHIMAAIFGPRYVCVRRGPELPPELRGPFSRPSVHRLPLFVNLTRPRVPESRGLVARLAEPRRRRQVGRVQTGNRLLSLPFEIRERIYLEALVSNHPIRVHDGWTRRFVGTQKTDLHLATGLLRTCRQVYQEVQPILYGHNVFEYILRDPPPRASTIDAEPTEDDISLFNSEEEERGPRGRSSHLIDVEKFGQFFRRVMITIDRNRSIAQHKNAVVVALRSIRERLTDGDILQSIVINISPTIASGSANGPITFVDFFNPSSAIIQDLMKMRYRVLKVMVHWPSRDPKHLAGGLLEIATTPGKAQLDQIPTKISAYCESYFNACLNGQFEPDNENLDAEE